MRIKFAPVSLNDSQLLFELHRISMSEIVNRVFGWDDGRQHAMFCSKFSTMDHFWILLDEEPVGAVRLKELPGLLEIRSIEIYPKYQNQGIGTALIQHLIQRAHHEKIELFLRAFQINPAINLLMRMGFKIYDENDTHFMLIYRP